MASRGAAVRSRSLWHAVICVTVTWSGGRGQARDSEGGGACALRDACMDACCVHMDTDMDMDHRGSHL